MESEVNGGLRPHPIVSAASGTVIGFLIGCGCPAINSKLHSPKSKLVNSDLSAQGQINQNLFTFSKKTALINYNFYTKKLDLKENII
ncbi:MAG: hypothetical protein IKE65_10285 [Clostridia bacterium]|nr:hypothetical protein [Clostridia bacterium]